jgi:hypothetical protein
MHLEGRVKKTKDILKKKPTIKRNSKKKISKQLKSKKVPLIEKRKIPRGNCVAL